MRHLDVDEAVGLAERVVRVEVPGVVLGRRAGGLPELGREVRVARARAHQDREQPPRGRCGA